VKKASPAQFSLNLFAPDQISIIARLSQIVKHCLVPETVLSWEYSAPVFFCIWDDIGYELTGSWGWCMKWGIDVIEVGGCVGVWRGGVFRGGSVVSLFW
jgi:hypothetical protein